MSQKICPRCGGASGEWAPVCEKCGLDIQMVQATPSASPMPGTAATVNNPQYQQFPAPAYIGVDPNYMFEEDISAAEMALYVGDNAHVYLPRFQKMKMTGSKISWNWATFFLSVYHMFYRRHIKAGLIYMLISYAFSLPSSVYSLVNSITSMSALMESAANDPYNFSYATSSVNPAASLLSLISPLVSLLLMCGIAMFFNHMYYKRAVENIRKAKSISGDMNQYQYHLKSLGGTKIANPLIYAGISVGIGIFIGIAFFVVIIGMMM